MLALKDFVDHDGLTQCELGLIPIIRLAEEILFNRQFDVLLNVPTTVFVREACV